MLRAGAWHARSWIRPWAYYRTWRTRAADLSLSLSEVKVRVGPVPTDWSLARVKDALFQIGQVDVAYVGKTATDGTHTCELYV